MKDIVIIEPKDDHHIQITAYNLVGEKRLFVCADDEAGAVEREVFRQLAEEKEYRLRMHMSGCKTGECED